MLIQNSYVNNSWGPAGGLQIFVAYVTCSMHKTTVLMCHIWLQQGFTKGLSTLRRRRQAGEIGSSSHTGPRWHGAGCYVTARYKSAASGKGLHGLVQILHY